MEAIFAFIRRMIDRARGLLGRPDQEDPPRGPQPG